MTETDAVSEDQLLARARQGNHRAFERAVEPYVEQLQRHCYRMTASLDDADDILQETLFRAWRGLGTFAGRSSFRAWLYRIATNRSLDVVSGRAWRDTNVTTVDLEEPPWLQPLPTNIFGKEPADPAAPSRGDRASRARVHGGVAIPLTTRTRCADSV